MNYITHTRFKGLAVCGEYLNLPYGTELETEGNFLVTEDRNAVCVVTSENAKLHFSRNDDGMGLERGKLATEIKKRLSKRDAKYQTRWDALWEDAEANRLRRADIPDFWIWSDAFYNAEIPELEHILKLIKI